MGTKRSKQKENNLAAKDILANKLSFTSGMALILSMLISAAELFTKLHIAVYIVSAALILIAFLFFIFTKMCNKWFQLKAVYNVGVFLTLDSIVFFYLDNTIIRPIDNACKIDAMVVAISWFAISVLGILILLLPKRTARNAT